MDPIEEVDGKKKRRTMLDNMQRSSSLFQSRVTKDSGKAAEKARQQAEQPDSSQDHLDFSSEFSNQDTGFHSEGKADVAQSWEDLIEDDDWLNEDEEEEEEEGSSSGFRPYDPEEDEESVEEWKPPARGSFKPQLGGFRPVSDDKPLDVDDDEEEEAAEQEPTTETQLGYSWGAVEEKGEKPAPKPAQGSGTPDLSRVSGTPDLSRTRGNVPLAGTRRGGWENFPQRDDFSHRRRPLGVMLPPRGQLEKVEPAIVSAARLLIATPEGEPGYEECIRLLGRFGLGAIRKCSRAKVKVHILDEKDFVSFEALQELGLEQENYPVDGAYLVENRICLIDRRCLTEKPRFFHPALYYLAHALDHAQGGEDFSSRQSAAVVACYEACLSGLNGADFVDELAATDPVRYFARSVSIYLGRDDCTDPIWTHKDLYDFDKSIYDYLQYLFARFAT